MVVRGLLYNLLQPKRLTLKERTGGTYLKSNVIAQRATTAILLLASLATQAQTPPSAGSLLQEIERSRTQQLPKAVKPEIAPAPKEMKAPTGLTLTVKQFRFTGNRLLDAGQLAPVVAPYLGRQLDFAELQKAAAAVAARYREDGWVVRAYLPQQDIDNGVVTIHIIEAVFGGALLEGEPPSRVKLQTALAFVEEAVRKGEPLNGDAIDRALLLLDDLPGIAAAGNLKEGRRDGETDLVLKLADEAAYTGDAGIDDSGSRSTGATRLTLNLNANSPLGIADLETVSLIHTEGSDYARLGATVPVGTNGWRVGGSTSHLDYRLISPDFATMNGKGTSETYGLEASYPLLRTRLRNLYLALNADRKNFRNEANGAVTSDYHLDAFSIALNGNLFDALGGGGANTLGLTLTDGRVDLGGSPNQAGDATTTVTQGHYSKLRYSLSRQQTLTEKLALYGAVSGQIAGKNLDPAEKFYLGGATGVRAYPASEGGGSEGQMLNLELRARLPENFTLTAFYDWGEVLVNRDNSHAGAAVLNQYRLRGHGLMLGWLAPFGANFRLTWARRDGGNPNATAAGNDQDGSLVENRLWLQATLPF